MSTKFRISISRLGLLRSGPRSKPTIRIFSQRQFQPHTHRSWKKPLPSELGIYHLWLESGLVSTIRSTPSTDLPQKIRRNLLTYIRTYKGQTVGQGITGICQKLKKSHMTRPLCDFMGKLPSLEDYGGGATLYAHVLLTPKSTLDRYLSSSFVLYGQP